MVSLEGTYLRNLVSSTSQFRIKQAVFRLVCSKSFGCLGSGCSFRFQNQGPEYGSQRVAGLFLNGDPQKGAPDS